MSAIQRLLETHEDLREFYIGHSQHSRLIFINHFAAAIDVALAAENSGIDPIESLVRAMQRLSIELGRRDEERLAALQAADRRARES